MLLLARTDHPDEARVEINHLGLAPFFDIEGVTGSIPVSPTIPPDGNPDFPLGPPCGSLHDVA